MSDEHPTCEFTDAQMQFLKDIFTPRCCHTTGMHNPRHFEDKKYVCNDQKARAFDRGRELLCLGEVTVDDSIPEEDCYWCNQARERLMDEHRACSKCSHHCMCTLLLRVVELINEYQDMFHFKGLDFNTFVANACKYYSETNEEAANAEKGSRSS